MVIFGANDMLPIAYSNFVILFLSLFVVYHTNIMCKTIQSVSHAKDHNSRATMAGLGRVGSGRGVGVGEQNLYWPRVLLL